MKLKLREAKFGIVLNVRTEQLFAVQLVRTKPISTLTVTVGTAENRVLKLMV